jgi:hypothetical protein
LLKFSKKRRRDFLLCNIYLKNYHFMSIPKFLKKLFGIKEKQEVPVTIDVARFKQEEFPLVNKVEEAVAPEATAAAESVVVTPEVTDAVTLQAPEVSEAPVVEATVESAPKKTAKEIKSKVKKEVTEEAKPKSKPKPKKK